VVDFYNGQNIDANDISNASYIVATKYESGARPDVSSFLARLGSAGVMNQDNRVFVILRYGPRSDACAWRVEGFTTLFQLRLNKNGDQINEDDWSQEFRTWVQNAMLPALRKSVGTQALPSHLVRQVQLPRALQNEIDEFGSVLSALDPALKTQFLNILDMVRKQAGAH